jgi:AcrR family transcriptional regulator
VARKRSDDKRRRILQAAVKVFARKGYFAARVAEIARRAGVADGTIYLYFRGKEDILVSLFDELMAEHVERARAEMQAVEDAPSRLRLIAEHHLRALGADRDLAVVFQVELRQSTKFLERFSLLARAVLRPRRLRDRAGPARRHLARGGAAQAGDQGLLRNPGRAGHLVGDRAKGL